MKCMKLFKTFINLAHDLRLQQKCLCGSSVSIHITHRHPQRRTRVQINTNVQIVIITKPYSNVHLTIYDHSDFGKTDITIP